jgi:hypothetical protein
VLREKDVLDRAKFGRFVGGSLSNISVAVGTDHPGALMEQIRRLPCEVKERELSTARKVVHRVLTMFDSHYPGAGPHITERRLGSRLLRRPLRQS